LKTEGKKTKKEKEKREKLAKKKRKALWITVCNPQCFVCGGTVIPPHHLDSVIIYR
jgi:hypothetical protein